MKIYIGPYKSYIGPYQIIDALFFWQEKYPDKKQTSRWDYKLSDRLSEWLADTWVNTICEWIESKRKRQVNIKIHEYDSWNTDSTLAMITLPLLRALKTNKHGYALVDSVDVSEAVLVTNRGIPDDDLGSLKYDWVLSEIIWTFEQLQPDCDGERQFYSGEHDFVFEQIEGSDCVRMVKGERDTFKIDREGLNAYNSRIENGLRLFGKYYRTLWD